MKRTPKGLYKVAGDFVECRVQKTDTYADLVERAAGLFGLAEEEGQTLSRFKNSSFLLNCHHGSSSLQSVPSPRRHSLFHSLNEEVLGILKT